MLLGASNIYDVWRVDVSALTTTQELSTNQPFCKEITIAVIISWQVGPNACEGLGIHFLHCDRFFLSYAFLAGIKP